MVLREWGRCYALLAKPKVHTKMQSNDLIGRLRANPFGAAMAFAVVCILAKAIFLGAGMQDNFATMGNDDVMRLSVVRDLIAGQPWFDTMQYRMVPPEGLSLHWSRYIDAGIAAIILPLSWIMPMELAEQIAATVWPTLIMLLTLIVVAFGTRRIFGAAPACFAILSLAIWPLTANVHMSPGNLDHHNVQFLMMVLMIFAVIWPENLRKAGVVAGLAAAFSLAVGLESVLFIVVAGLILVVRASFAAEVTRLVTFCAALAVGSAIFWLGQTPPATRMMPVCDQLGTPMLSLVGVAVAASLLPLLLGRRPALTLCLTAVLAGFGLVIIWPLLGPCLAGPYGDLPQELQDFISSSIVEALPAIGYTIDYPVPAITFLLPVIAALVLGSLLWLAERATMTDAQSAALSSLLVFCAFGFAIVFYQMRTVIMAASVAPVIGGVVMSRLFAGYLQDRDVTRGLLLIMAVAAFIAPAPVAVAIKPLISASNQTGAPSGGSCRNYASLQSLNAIPPGLILTHGNFGAHLIWATHHSGLSAPYHRSAAALGNGIFPFGMESSEMATYVRATGATHLLLCRDTAYRGDFATKLAAGGRADWLLPVALDDEDQVLFAVLPK
jgi:hypothetical protein